MKRAASGSAASRGKRAASAATIATQQGESAVDIELAEAVATNGEDDPCPYDKQRNQNVARNKAYLMKLGLDDEKNKLDAAAAASKPVRKPKTKRAPPPPREKVQRKSAVEVRAEEEAARAERYEAAAKEDPSAVQRRKRANNDPRPSDRQMEFLDEHHDETHELTTTERSAIEAYGEPWRRYGTKGSFGKDTDGTFYKAMRAGLRATEGVRRPKWLDDIEALWPRMGTTKDAHHHTMYGLELAAAGGGFYWRARHKDAELGEEAYNRFRVGVPLTLGCDTESIKEAGRRFEAVEGKDAGNGWGFTHYLGKVKNFQEHTLTQMDFFDDGFEGKTLRELEVAEEAAGERT